MFLSWNRSGVLWINPFSILTVQASDSASSDMRPLCSYPNSPITVSAGSGPRFNKRKMLKKNNICWGYMDELTQCSPQRKNVHLALYFILPAPREMNKIILQYIGLLFLGKTLPLDTMKSLSFAVSISGQSYELNVSPGVWTQKLFDRAAGHSKTCTWTASYLAKGASKTMDLQCTNKGKML